jgi:hypothetical protein
MVESLNCHVQNVGLTTKRLLSTGVIVSEYQFSNNGVAKGEAFEHKRARGSHKRNPNRSLQQNASQTLARPDLVFALPNHPCKHANSKPSSRISGARIRSTAALAYSRQSGESARDYCN